MLWQDLQAAEAQHTYASQPLAAALEEFARATGLQLVYRTEFTEGLISKGAGAQLTAAETLRELLRDTGLGFAFINDQTVTIVRAKGTNDPASQLDPAHAMSGVIGRSVSGDSNNRNDTRGTPTMHRSLLARLASIFAACGTAAVTWTACAQDAGQKASAELQLEEVVITGSRVIKDGNDSPTPVTVVTVEDIQATHPATVYEGLLDMPQFGGSKGTATANPGGAGGNNNNINAPNLRGLGSLRTLVLYDGHRMPPTQQSMDVDANMIPQMLLQRVDVVTGGASAVYGSDAIAGVVNFVTDRKFNGVKVQARGGMSTYHDDGSYEVGVAFGTDLFGGRGHFEGSLETSDDQGILHRTNRSNFVPRWTVQGNGCISGTTTCIPYNLVGYATINNYAFGGLVTGPATNPYAQTSTAAGYAFKSNGVLSPFNKGLTGAANGIADGNISIGGDGTYHTGATLKAQLGFQQEYGRFDFDLTDNTHWFVTASASQNHQFNYDQDSQISLNLSTSNAFLPAAYVMPGTTFTLAKMFGGNNPDGASLVPTRSGDVYVKFLYLSTGLEGSFGDYKWEAAYVHGDSKQHARLNGNINNGRLLAASDAVKDSSGNTICYDQSTLGAHLYPGCVPINLFGPTSESQAAVDYVTGATNYHTQNKSDDISGSISGAPFNSWAGPVDMAVSGDWRKLNYHLESEALPALDAPLNCAAFRITGNCNANTNQWLAGSTPNRPPVSETVGEAAFEANLPVLKDKPFVQAADLNTAVRYARYSIQGNPVPSLPDIKRTFNALTWKAGLGWHVNDEWTVRAVRSRDFRAPNLDELFRPGSITVNTGFADTLIQPNAIPSNPSSVIQSGGNPLLDPEIGYTTTIGVVFKPSPDFSVAIDGYDIRLKNFIPSGPNGVAGTAPNIQAACYASGYTSPYCALIVRPITDPSNPAYRTAANQATKFYQTLLNVAEQHTYGVDTELNYKMELGGHPLSLRGLIAYQPHVTVVQEGLLTVDAAGTINGAGAGPVGGKVRVSAFARYGITDSLTVDWLTRWRSGLKAPTDPTQVVGTPDPYSPATAWSNVNFSYRFNPSFGQADVYFNVQNVFNQMPHPTSFNGSRTVPGYFGGLALGDDPVGRYYTVGIRVKM